MDKLGIEYQRITPLWPQANSEAERFMKPLTKAVRSAHVEGRNWNKEMYIFLLNYRATTHATTGFSPSQLLFNRHISVKLPQFKSSVISEKDAAVREKDDMAKKMMKVYADTKRRAQPSQIKVGDVVLLRQKKTSKFSTKFDPSPFHVVKMKGTMVTVTRNGKYLARYVSLLKKVNGQNFPEESEEFTDDVVEEESNSPDTPVPVPARNASGGRYPNRGRHTARRYGQNVYDS